MENVDAKPAPAVNQTELAEWYELNRQLKDIKDREMALRKKIFNAAFPDPKEGTNTFALPDGYALKGQFKWNRDVDVGAFRALGERFAAAGINAESMVRFKPELSGTNYKTLTAEQQHLFDQCLVIKPGSPSLEVVMPKKRATASQLAQGTPGEYDADAAGQ